MEVMNDNRIYCIARSLNTKSGSVLQDSQLHN